MRHYLKACTCYKLKAQMTFLHQGPLALLHDSVFVPTLQVVPCLALHDTMRHIKSDVVTVGFGGCMGMSGFLLAVGKKV